MKRPAFAMLPSAWVKRPKLETTPGPGRVAIEENGTIVAYGHGGLYVLQWRQHKGASTASLLILFALAVISNRAQRQEGRREDNLVAATYEQIQAMVPLSRKLICDGLQLLEATGAITSARDGRRNLYALVGIDQGGKWCQLPQQHLQNMQSHLMRLKLFVDQIRRPSSLHALKLYMLILAFRDNHTNFASIGYEKIGEYSGMRREEVSVAIQILVSAELCRLVSDEEAPRRKGDPMHNRYFVKGLAAS